MFHPVSNKTDFPAIERDMLAFWESDQTFEKTLAKTAEKPDYVFYDGPPFATGLPHYGHLLAGTIKDIVPRYQTMRGFHVERRFGWDCHGLPIEALAQDALGVSGAPAIKALGVDVFNEKCRSMVSTYVNEWKKTVTRMGRWVDFDHGYKTMDRDFMESIWWVFKQLWDQGRIYKSYRVVPYSPKLSTPLANSEASSNYKDVQDPTITVRAKVLSGAKAEWGTTYLLIWTTTPWTIPENLAICAGAEIDYVAAKDVSDGAVYILAEARLESVFHKKSEYEIVARMKGNDLLGWTYEPIFPFFADFAKDGCFRVLNDNYVSTGDGTGLVHIAPAYGEDDFRVCKAAGIEVIADPLDASCAFTEKIPEYQGRFCKDCDKDIIRRLKEGGKLVHQSTIVHSYPFCERTEAPLIYRAINAWYVRVEDMRDAMVANNEGVHWMPDYVGTRRFANWLKDACDWNISRNRFWGSCIPVWIEEKDPTDSTPPEMICVGSIAELEALSGETVNDLHKHFVDKVVIRKGGKTFRRTPEVLDCWFESGSMPYAQDHYPFAQKSGVDGTPPPPRWADFIAEGLDQTRGWFFSLMRLSTALFGVSAYKNVVVNGLVLAEDGKKMSKRLHNYPDPVNVIEEYGADAVRLYMIYSPVVRAEDLRFSESGVKQVLRELLIPWWNAYSFFVTYANVDGFYETEVTHPNSANLLDRWIVSSMETLVHDVTEAMDNYDLQRAVRPFVAFIEALTNWYIRRSRRRFWKSQNDADKTDAYRTLRYVLVQLCKVAAPFTPFISEAIYRNLRGASDPESVHLCDFPTADASARDEELERSMALVQQIVGLGRQLRTENDLKVRQPLSAIHLVSAKLDLAKELGGAFEELLLDELNIKSATYGRDETALADITVKADFRKLGPRFGAKMKLVAGAIANLDTTQIVTLLNGGTVKLTLSDGSDAEIGEGDVTLRRAPKNGLVVASAGDVVIAVETELTLPLVQEGLAREFVSRVQNLRKEADFDVVQRITVTVDGDAELRTAVESFADYCKGETLADEIRFAPLPDIEEVVLNGHSTKLSVAKVTATREGCQEGNRQ
ncbi:MAG: isoleucine--tRNA ligase [Kiritimatiellae bacterium]|nr:isoleucine--tRNA ligase [Kiritimatiellia bacterium]